MMSTLYCIVSIGFLVYTLHSLKNFYASQLISIQKWLRYLLAFLILYDSPVHLYVQSHTEIAKVFHVISKFGEFFFLSLVMYFWLEIKSMNKPASSNSNLDAIGSKKHNVLFSKCLLMIVIAQNAPRMILSISSDMEILNEKAIALISQIAVSSFLIYGLCVLAVMFKVCIESDIERNFKFLCYFSYCVFLTYSYICY